MARKNFTASEIKILEKNQNVLKVSESTITYTKGFKSEFIVKYLNGVFPRTIFERNGFDVEMIGMKRVEQAASRWKQAYEKDGLLGLNDSRKSNQGRPCTRVLTEREKLLKLEAKVKFLEMENDFLKKLRKIRKGEI